MGVPTLSAASHLKWGFQLFSIVLPSVGVPTLSASSDLEWGFQLYQHRLTLSGGSNSISIGCARNISLALLISSMISSSVIVTSFTRFPRVSTILLRRASRSKSLGAIASTASAEESFSILISWYHVENPVPISCVHCSVQFFMVDDLSRGVQKEIKKKNIGEISRGWGNKLFGDSFRSFLGCALNFCEITVKCFPGCYILLCKYPIFVAMTNYTRTNSCILFLLPPSLSSFQTDRETKTWCLTGPKLTRLFLIPCSSDPEGFDGRQEATDDVAHRVGVFRVQLGFHLLRFFLEVEQNLLL